MRAAHRARAKPPEPAIEFLCGRGTTSQQTDRPAAQKSRNQRNDQEPGIACERAAFLENPPTVQHGDEPKQRRGGDEIRFHGSPPPERWLMDWPSRESTAGRRWFPIAALVEQSRRRRQGRKTSTSRHADPRPAQP